MYAEVETGNRIKIITGHFGSGKTEFSINYALYLRQFFDKVAAVDLDIINTYFRIREQMDFLAEKGIESFSSNIPRGNSLDIPAIDPAILKPLQNEDYMAVLDVGGNPKGSLSLGRYREILSKTGYDHYFVINRNRPETKDYKSVREFIGQMEGHSQTKITGIINTTHMLKNTSVDDILYGDELAREVSEKLNLPYVYAVCLRDIEKEVRSKDIGAEIFPIDLYFRKDWML
ncbi:MinD superfamily P-loop ATPase [Peptoniphilus olsenii]|uniref:MinD superfamily P-loop ATPase n=1 Tax=Peptoniphilus olsenii TaxID=411570 RepID=A0ABV2J8S1_9FIRM